MEIDIDVHSSCMYIHPFDEILLLPNVDLFNGTLVEEEIEFSQLPISFRHKYCTFSLWIVHKTQ